MNGNNTSLKITRSEIKTKFKRLVKRDPTEVELDALEKRSRPLEKKTVWYYHKRLFRHKDVKLERHRDNKDNRDNDSIEITLNAGLCPCGVCNHVMMEECEINDCQCCSEQCT